MNLRHYVIAWRGLDGDRGAVLLSLTAAGVLGLTALAYYRTHSEDPGLTTEIALVLNLVLGGPAICEPLEAAALAVVVANLLAAREPMHRFVRNVLTQSELRSGLIFAASTLVVWHVIPDGYFDPFAAVNPRSIWTVMIIIRAISVQLCCRTRAGFAIWIADVRFRIRLRVEQRDDRCYGGVDCGGTYDARARCGWRVVVVTSAKFRDSPAHSDTSVQFQPFSCVR